MVTMQQQQNFHAPPLFLPEQDEHQEHGSSLVDDLLQGPFLSTPPPSTSSAAERHRSCSSGNTNMTAYHDDDDDDKARNLVTLRMQEEPSAARRSGHNNKNNNSNALYYSTFSMLAKEEPVNELQQHQRNSIIAGTDCFDDKEQEPTERRSHDSSSNSNVTAASTIGTTTDLNTVNLEDDDDDDHLTHFLTPAQEQPKPSAVSAGGVGNSSSNMSRIITGFTETFGTPAGIATTMRTTNPTDDDSNNASFLYAKSCSHDSSSGSSKENEEQALTSSTRAGRGFTKNQPSPTNMVLGIVIDSAPVLLGTSPQVDSDSSTLYPKSHSSNEEERDVMSPMSDVTLTWQGPLLVPKKPLLSPAMIMANKKTKGPGVLLQATNQDVLPNENAIFNKSKTSASSNNNTLFFLERKVERLDKKVTLLHNSMTEIHDTVMQSLLDMKIQMAPLEDATNRHLVLEKRLEGMALALQQALHLTKERLDRLEEQKHAFQVPVVIALGCIAGLLLSHMIR
jgi:hypothetical protein